MAKEIGDKSCQSNFDKQSSGFGSFLISYLITTVNKSEEFRKHVFYEFMTLLFQNLYQIIYMYGYVEIYTWLFLFLAKNLKDYLTRGGLRCCKRWGSSQ